MATPRSSAATLLLISGLAREAAIFAGPDRFSICGDAPTLRAKLARLQGPGLRLVMSVGICGGLDPALRPGQLVVGAGVVSTGETIATDPAATAALRRRLAEAGRPAAVGHLAGVDAPVLTAVAKAALRTSSRAVAVDMESQLAGRFARRLGVPFVILRAVSDPAERDLPSLVLEAVDPDGRTNLGAVVAGLACSPGRLPRLLGAARDSGAAFAALRKVAAIVGGFAADGS